MRSSYLIVVLVLVGLLGCDALKGFMPAPTANKPISVPEKAVTVALDSQDGINLPANQPGDYYFVENDTRNVVLFFTVPLGENSATAFTQKRHDQLDTKRKYQVYYMANAATTQPGYRFVPGNANPPAAVTPAGNPLAPATMPAAM